MDRGPVRQRQVDDRTGDFRRLDVAWQAIRLRHAGPRLKADGDVVAVAHDPVARLLVGADIDTAEIGVIFAV